jgi:hypothetical protein
MKRSPSRFRPCLDALEDRSLPSVSVSLIGGELAIDASQSTVPIRVIINNDGHGLIRGAVGGDTGDVGSFNGGLGFSNVTLVVVRGGSGGCEIDYFQAGNQVNGVGLAVVAEFGRGTNQFNAGLEGTALTNGRVGLTVAGGYGQDTINIEATGVNIGPKGGLDVSVQTPAPTGGGGTDTFLMNYSGINQAPHGLTVRSEMNPLYTHNDLTLRATFLGGSFKGALPGRGSIGAAAGDLSLTGENVEMLLSGAAGVSETGDAFGLAGEASCVRTPNVTPHNFAQDFVVPLSRFITHH